MQLCLDLLRDEGKYKHIDKKTTAVGREIENTTFPETLDENPQCDLSTAKRA